MRVLLLKGVEPHTFGPLREIILHTAPIIYGPLMTIINWISSDARSTILLTPIRDILYGYMSGS